MVQGFFMDVGFLDKSLGNKKHATKNPVIKTGFFILTISRARII